MAGEPARRRRRANANQAATGSAPVAEGDIRVRPPDPRVREKLRYRFDALLARGPLGVIALLFVITMSFVVVAAAIIALAGSHYGQNGSTYHGFGEDFWQSVLRVLDTGTVANDPHWGERIVALIVTLAGIIIASALIGVIATGFEQRIEALQRGRGAVIESGHTLILGRSPRMYAIISELVIANESQRRPAIVVLSTSEKAEIEDEVDSRVDDLKNTRLIFRTGDPANPANLERVAIATARSVVVLADEQSDGDAGVVKATLAAYSMLADSDASIVVELDSASTAEALTSACGDRVLPVQAADVIAKVVAQACRQAGLGAVYRELLDFDGDEIYPAETSQVVGRRFGDILLSYSGCTLMGVQHADGTLELGPSMDLVIAEGDELYVVAEDDSVVRYSGDANIAAAPPADGAPATGAAERLLVIGWSDLGGRIVTALDGMLPAGTTLRIAVDPEILDPADVVVPSITHQAEVVANSGIANLDVSQFDQIFVLGYRGRLSQADADARTLLTIIMINRALDEAGHRARVVAEVLESRTVPIAATAGIDDFVVSDDLASLMMAQLSENAQLSKVFAELFGSTGPTISMQPASRYIALGDHSWQSVVLAVARRGDLALGYRNADLAVIVNPKETGPIGFGEHEQIVVLTRHPL
jgi:K+/H+ antiporter YhaU regulatory subunit KhtT